MPSILGALARPSMRSTTRLPFTEHERRNGSDVELLGEVGLLVDVDARHAEAACAPCARGARAGSPSGVRGPNARTRRRRAEASHRCSLGFVLLRLSPRGSGFARFPCKRPAQTESLHWPADGKLVLDRGVRRARRGDRGLARGLVGRHARGHRRGARTRGRRRHPGRPRTRPVGRGSGRRRWWSTRRGRLLLSSCRERSGGEARASGRRCSSRSQPLRWRRSPGSRSSVTWRRQSFPLSPRACAAALPSATRGFGPLPKTRRRLRCRHQDVRALLARPSETTGRSIRT